MAACALLLVLPIKIPYSINVPGKLLPAREWILTRGTDGRLITMLMDHKEGMNQSYSVRQFERGDAVRFSFHHGITSNRAITAGDTVASIYSNEIERQIVRLRGEMAAQAASLKLYLTGEKASIVNEAEKRLAFEKKQAEEEKKKHQRLKQLYERDLISKQEFELTQSDVQLVDLNVAIAEAELQTVQSGAKEERIEMIHSRINALQQEIQTLQKRAQDFTLTSPISGVAKRTFSSDTLMVIADTTEYVVIMPILWRDRDYVSLKKSVRLNSSVAHIQDAILLKLDNNVYNLSGRQVVLAIALVNGKMSAALPGLFIRCSISCGSVGVMEYLSRKMKSLFI
ncbi:MAG: hypothetical protein ACE5IR_09160 [bacterium]